MQFVRIVGHPPLVASFQRVLNGGERVLKVRYRTAYCSFSDDGTLCASEPCLLGTHDHDQVEAKLLRVSDIADTKGEVQRRFEIMARIELLLGDGKGYRIAGLPRMVSTCTMRKVGFNPNFTLAQ